MPKKKGDDPSTIGRRRVSPCAASAMSASDLSRSRCGMDQPLRSRQGQHILQPTGAYQPEQQLSDFRRLRRPGPMQRARCQSNSIYCKVGTACGQTRYFEARATGHGRIVRQNQKQRARAGDPLAIQGHPGSTALSGSETAVFEHVPIEARRASLRRSLIELENHLVRGRQPEHETGGRRLRKSPHLNQVMNLAGRQKFHDRPMGGSRRDRTRPPRNWALNSADTSLALNREAARAGRSARLPSRRHQPRAVAHGRRRLSITASASRCALGPTFSKRDLPSRARSGRAVSLARAWVLNLIG